MADLTIQVDPAVPGRRRTTSRPTTSPALAERRLARPPGRHGAVPVAGGAPRQGALFGGYLVAVYLAMRNSVFYDRERLFPWLFVGVAILVIGSGWRRILELVLYWVPFFLLWVAYDLIRGQADNGRDVATTQPITLEKALFAGYVPNNVLQDRFYVPEQVQWWEALTGLTYMSHFFVVYITAAVLFVRNRERFIRWMTALVLLTILGLLGYWLYPMAPPWMAADQGLLPDLARPGTRGLRLLHLQFADRLWVHGKDNSQMINPVGGHALAARGVLDAVQLVLLQAGPPPLGQGAPGPLSTGHGFHADVRRRALLHRPACRMAPGHLRRGGQRPLPRLARASVTARSAASRSEIPVHAG